MRKPYKEVVVPESRYYVYALYHPEEEVPFYIGKGSGDRYRQYGRTTTVKRNKDFVEYLSKIHATYQYYEVVFLYETDFEDDAYHAETVYIRQYGMRSEGSGSLFNLVVDEKNPTGLSLRANRPVYLKGFVFPSVKVALKALNKSHRSLEYDVKNGKASYLDVENQVQRVFENEARSFKQVKYSYFYQRRIQSFKVAKKYWKCKFAFEKSRSKIQNPVIIDGVEYPSLQSAAHYFGYKKGHSLKKFLLRGNHNHTFEIMK